MISKHDWDDALKEWIREEREALGGPPTAEEVAAFLGGELSGAEAARIRALLVYYPELTPLLDARIEKPRKVISMRFLAAAAMLTIVTLSTLLAREQQVNDLPVIHSSRHELHAFRPRGSGNGYQLPAGQQRYLLIVVPEETPTSTAYELEIARGPRVIWSASDVRPIDDTFDLSIPGKFLKPGTYTLNIYSLAGERRLTDSYTIGVQ